MADGFSIQIKDLPEQLTLEIERTIRPFALPLCLDDRLIGSGTLIAWDDRFGILTAQHVPTRSGLDFSTASGQRLGTVLREGAHFFTLPMKLLRLIQIGIPRSESEGPDLAVIEIPRNLPELGTLQAVRSFWNLSVKTEERLERSLEDGDPAVLVGNPAELIKERGPEGGFDAVRQLYGLSGFGGIGHRYSASEFDFFEYEVDYSGTDSPPESFGGVSGGGIWVAPIRREGADSPVIMAHHPILAGVAFYQGPRTDERRVILCHGGRSIYDVTLTRLRG